MSNSQVFKLLILGSRNATPAMIDAAARAVERAAKLGWVVITGDAPGVDQAVIAACELHGVRYAAAYSKDKLNRATVGPLGTAVKAPVKGYDARDKWLVDAADRCLFIWDGKSKGTNSAYLYACRKQKQADRLRLVVAKTDTVEVLVDTQAAEQGYAGAVRFRAYDRAGNLLAQRAEQRVFDAINADAAKLRTVNAAMQILTEKLGTHSAPYSLRVVQSSQNVDGWLGKGWRRKSEVIVALSEQYDALRTQFPSVQFQRQSAQALRAQFMQ